MDADPAAALRAAFNIRHPLGPASPRPRPNQVEPDDGRRRNSRREASRASRGRWPQRRKKGTKRALEDSRHRPGSGRRTVGALDTDRRPHQRPAEEESQRSKAINRPASRDKGQIEADDKNADVPACIRRPTVANGTRRSGRPTGGTKARRNRKAISRRPSGATRPADPFVGGQLDGSDAAVMAPPKNAQTARAHKLPKTPSVPTPSRFVAIPRRSPAAQLGPGRHKRVPEVKSQTAPLLQESQLRRHTVNDRRHWRFPHHFVGHMAKSAPS